ncbi:sensor histidine kinase [Serinicoccus kebangsaanensis]|uniref:sensor histidine kinase n=1 Tax=Serinicoccus kebangsaanensis TaxID=2602069 RepID=UPI00124F072E|nr:sensor histidine kinase [Serinicoccus kebangsaanensis]
MNEWVQAVRQQASEVWSRARGVSWLPDALLVAVLLFLLLVTGVGAGTLPLTLVSLLLVVPLLWRRSHPLPVALVIAAGCLIQVLLVDSPVPANVAVLIAVYSAAAFGNRTTSRLVLGLGLAGALIAALDWAGSIYGGLGYYLAVAAIQAVFMACFVGVAWALGDVMRRRREVVARLQAQNRALARDQAQRQRLAAQDERASIAREMHDVVAHSLAVVVVQADGGLYAARQALSRGTDLDADRARVALEQAAGTLETLADTARASLTDTRRLVGVLRDAGSDAEYSPLQGLAHLDELVERVRASGVDVDAHVRGEVGGLSPEADLAAYRVVQEALTNAMKHAGPDASVDVDVLRTPGVLMVRVTDDGRGALAQEPDGEGNGLLGMRERVEVLGGTVHAGPRRRQGWEVVATFPVDARDEPADHLDVASGSPETAHTPGGDR